MKRKKRATTKKRVAKTPIVVKICLVIIVFFIFFATIYKITEVMLINKENGFPKLSIFLKDVPIEEIDTRTKDIKYPDNIVTLTVDNKPVTYENVEIRGRGNYTWGLAKKPYQIKFSEKTDLFNFGAARKWVLLANYTDPTHLRNNTAFYISNLLSEEYPLQGNYIELYIDNQYRGLYFLTEKIEINRSRVGLDDPFGIIVELDNLYGKEDECHRDIKRDCLVLKDSVNPDNKDASMQQFIDDFNALKIAISHKDWIKIENLIDTKSFAKYYLLNEFAVNPDAYSTSFYMYKNGGKIHAGPGWDFDVALSNREWASDGVNQEVFLSPFETMVLKNYLGNADAPFVNLTSTLFYDLMDIPEFEARVKEIYQETLSGKKDGLLSYIRNQADYIRDAAIRDQERWKLKTNFDEEVDYLIDWVGKRYDHFEETYGKDSPSLLETPAKPTDLENSEESTEV